MKEMLLNDDELLAVSGGVGGRGSAEEFSLTVKGKDDASALRLKLRLNHGSLKNDQIDTIVEKIMAMPRQSGSNTFYITISATGIRVEQ